MMTSYNSGINEDSMDDDYIDFSAMQETSDLDNASRQRDKAGRPGARHMIDVYMEERKLRNELRDIFEDEYF